MPITNAKETFAHELAVFDAEHRFLEAMQHMREMALNQAAA